MERIQINYDDFMLMHPESIEIKKNSNGTYNLYALIHTSYSDKNGKVRVLAGLKSEELQWKRDFGMSIDFSCETNYGDILGGKGTRLGRFITEVQRTLLYNLQFSKNIGTLVEFEILNKGEGKMEYNIYEGLEEYTVQVNVVGFTKEELSISLEDGVIKIEAKPENFLNIEDTDCKKQDFEKYKKKCEIYLPNTEGVKAELKDGVLYLTAPKKYKGIKIPIQIKE